MNVLEVFSNELIRIDPQLSEPDGDETLIVKYGISYILNAIGVIYQAVLPTNEALDLIDSIPTLSNSNHLTVLYGLVDAVMNHSDKFNTILISTSIFKDLIIHGSDINAYIEQLTDTDIASADSVISSRSF